MQMKKKYTYRGQKGKNKPSEPNNGIWAPKTVRSCHISIDQKFHSDKEKVFFQGSKDKNKPSEPKNGMWAPKSVWSCDISVDQKFHADEEKVYFQGSKDKNKPSEPKNGMWAPKSVWSVVWYIGRSEVSCRWRKSILSGVKKAKISLQSPTTEFGLQKQYGRVIYRSIRNFMQMKKKYTFRGRNGKNKPSEPKNGIRAPKSV
jgi:hypothetical protein